MMQRELNNWDDIQAAFGVASRREMAGSLRQRFLVTTKHERPMFHPEAIWRDVECQIEWQTDGLECYAQHFFHGVEKRQGSIEQLMKRREIIRRKRAVVEEYFRLAIAAGHLLLHGEEEHLNAADAVVNDAFHVVDEVHLPQSDAMSAVFARARVIDLKRLKRKREPYEKTKVAAWLNWLLASTDLRQLLLIDSNRGNWQTVPAFSYAITALRSKGKVLAATGPFGEVWLWAERHLKFNQKDGVQAIAHAGGTIRLADLALALKWARDYADAWNSFRREVNKKFAKHEMPWRVCPSGSNARLSKVSEK